MATTVRTIAHGMIHTGITTVGLHLSATTGAAPGTTAGAEAITTGTDHTAEAAGHQHGVRHGLTEAGMDIHQPS